MQKVSCSIHGISGGKDFQYQVLGKGFFCDPGEPFPVIVNNTELDSGMFSGNRLDLNVGDREEGPFSVQL